MLGTARRIAVAAAVVIAGTTVMVAGPADASAPVSVPSPSSSPAFAPNWAHTARDADAPDPDVERFGKTYYAYTTGTTWGNHIGVLESSSPNSGFHTITGLPYGSSAFPSIAPSSPIRSWQTQAGTHAPGVFFRGGKYIMFYAAETASGHGGRYCLSRATASKPAGPFVDHTTVPWLCMDAQGGAIDPDPFVDPSGKAWLYFKTYDDNNHSAQPSAIYVVPLSSNGLSIAGPKQVVLSQTAVSIPTETAENPQMSYVGGKYLLLISRGQWNSAGYRESYATCSGPQGPCAEGSPAPILSSYGNVRGPAGGVIFGDQRGRNWIAYQGWRGASGCAGYSGSSCARKLFVSRIQLGGGGSSGGGSGNGGYWMVDSGGTVYAFGAAANVGSAHTAFVTHIERTPSRHGYWIVNTAGQVSPFGDAKWKGNAPALAAGETVTSLSSTPSGNGYWLFTNTGRVLTYGDARFFGDMSGQPLNGPVVGSVATPNGHGYYMVASDGGIFTFGDARFHGSMGGVRLNQPVNGLVPTPANRGYWLVASDGGIFAFGDAAFRGSMGGAALNKPVIGMVRYGNGYLMVASDGGIFNFSTKAFAGSLGANPPTTPIVGVAAT